MSESDAIDRASNVVHVEDVSVVLCVRNAQEIIEACIDSVIATGIPVDQIIVIDGDSTDSTVEIVDRMGCSVTSDNGAGFTAARSLGVGMVTTEWTLILGPDDYLSPDAPSLLKEEMAMSPRIAAVQCRKRVRVASPTFFDRGMDRYYQRLPSGKVPVVGNPSLYQTSLLQTNEYDPSFPSNEDTDWCTRVRRMGYTLHRSDAASSFEIESMGFNEFRRRWRWYGRGDTAYVRKYWISDRRRALRHLTHPFREYLVRLAGGELARGRLHTAAFMGLAAYYRYLGLTEELLKSLQTSSRRSRDLSGR